MDSTYIKGRLGENTACSFLEDKGYIILARNFVYKGYEVDIIAQDKNEIVFIEVKHFFSFRFNKSLSVVQSYI